MNDALALVVERACRLVKDQDARIGDQRTGNRDALALATGQRRAALADDRVVAFGELQDEVMRAGKACGRDELNTMNLWGGIDMAMPAVG